MPTRYDVDRDALAELLAGEPRYRVDQVWDGLHRRLAAPAEMTNLPKSLRARLDAELPAALMPVADSTDRTGDTVKWLFALKGRRLSFEWALIDGTNDRPSDARELAELARSLPLPAHVNLIPLNPTPGYPTRGTPPPGITRFRRQLADLGVNATVRRNRGTDIDAACGQLAARMAGDRDEPRPAGGRPGGQGPADRVRGASDRHQPVTLQGRVSAPAR